MVWKRRGWMLVNILVLMLPGLMATLAVSAGAAWAQSAGAIATTRVADTVYRADGTAAAGTVIVSWGAFTTVTGQSVPGGSTSAAIGAGGALSVSLAPNAGATPMGSYYTAVYHLDDGTVTREYWVVPVSANAVALSALRNTVLPTSVAMQTVSKAYVDTAIAAAVTGHPLDSSTPYVLKAGDAMTGPLALQGDPTTSLQAADKHYVDLNITALASGIAQKVSTEPAATQTVAQPEGTQLQVNLLNGTEYASQYATGLGNNGIANAIASADCATGCDVKVEPGYPAIEGYTPQAWSSSAAAGTHVNDLRGGGRKDSYLNPVNPLAAAADAGQWIDVVSTRNADATAQRSGTDLVSSFGLVVTHEGLEGGSNLFPGTLERVPYFKTGFSALSVTGTYNTLGQHVLAPNAINCYGVGDCLIGSQFLTTSGGFRDEADEGTHPFDIQVQEDKLVFQGACNSGCVAGSTAVTITPSAAPGTQGEGRFLIDKNPSRVLTNGLLTGGGTGVPSATASFSGTSFPLSVFLSTSQPYLSQAHTMAPGPVLVTIDTSGVPAGFVTSTGALPNPGGLACVADRPNGFVPHNYEMVNYSVVDGTHLQVTFFKPHAAHATIAVGGLCGYGLEQTVDTAAGIRQVFPVIGSYSATGLYYAGGVTAVVGIGGQTSAYLNVSLPVAAIARRGGLVTVTTAGNLPVDLNGLTMTVAGVADSSYNGSFAVTTTGPNTFTYSAAGADSSSSGGTAGIVTGGYALYPMAEVLSVYNASTKKVDGQMTLAPNMVQWAPNDAVEEPHYFQELVAADTQFVGQTTPRPTTYSRAGVQYQQNVGPGVRGWSVANAVPATQYLGNGGTHTVPDIAYEATGIWKHTFDLQAGEQSVFSVHCNSHGCGKWNSGYKLFELDASVGVDTLGYQPQTSALNLSLRGSSYSFTPQAFTADTINTTAINAATINATTINATTISGAVSAGQLPVFGASGGSHRQGAVPDPGATAGASRYLREDGTWAAPAASGTVSNNNSSASSALAMPAGALADYSFLQGSGAVLSDRSGNGNDGTLGAGSLAPSWTQTGLIFSGQQSVQLPAALNTSKTFFAGIYINPLTTTLGTPNQYPVLISSTLGGGGVNLMYAKNGAASVYAYAPDVYAGNSHQTQSPNLMSGFHVLCYVLGTGSGNVDHVYIDGSEVSYSAQGASFGFQSAGNYVLGSSNTGPFTASGFAGTFYRFVSYGTQLPAATVQTVSQAILADVAARGVPVQPAPINLAIPQFLAAGTSVNAAYGLSPSQSWVQNMTLINQPAYGVTNFGITGLTVEAIDGSEANRAGLMCRTSGGPSIYTLLGGDNDWGMFPGATAQGVFNEIAGTVQTMKQAGCKVFVGTILSRGGNGAPGGSFDSFKDALDALILSNARAVGADGVIDFAANQLMGADGANSNPTYFQADHAHPTVAGQLLLAAAASNALNYAFGYNELNPHSGVSLPYTMTAADGYVSLAGISGAGTLTLPDCTGQSGAVYRINNPQAAFAISVKALNGSQLINGLPATTTVAVPANGTVTLRDVPNAKAVSGCHWEM